MNSTLLCDFIGSLLLYVDANANSGYAKYSRPALCVILLDTIYGNVKCLAPIIFIMYVMMLMVMILNNMLAYLLRML